jgi:hypothetical protein
MVLAQEEIDFLLQLAQIPFLPVARRADSDEPKCFEDGADTLVLQCLEKRGLISLDYDKPLKGFYSEAYDAYPIQGSFALTQRGQLVVELLSVQGVE